MLRLNLFIRYGNSKEEILFDMLSIMHLLSIQLMEIRNLLKTKFKQKYMFLKFLTVGEKKSIFYFRF